jgi:hypothetical protein
MKLLAQTNQEAFDLVVTHLKNQGRQAFADGACKYRTSDGLKCAIGALIPDEDYMPEWEGHSVGELISSFGLETASVDRGLLAELQYVHDCATTWHNVPAGRFVSHEGKKLLRATAHLYDLDPKIIDTVFVVKTGNEHDGLRK